MADVMQWAGAVALVVAGFLASLVTGFVVLGVALLVAGVAREARSKRGITRPPA